MHANEVPNACARLTAFVDDHIVHSSHRHVVHLNAEQPKLRWLFVQVRIRLLCIRLAFRNLSFLDFIYRTLTRLVLPADFGPSFGYHYVVRLDLDVERARRRVMGHSTPIRRPIFAQFTNQF